MLTETDLSVLRFAARAPRSIGAREDAVRAELGMQTIRYYQQRGLLPVPMAVGAYRHYPVAMNARIRFIKRAQERRRDFTVDWVHLKLNDQAQRTVLCKDPFRAVDDRVEKLIASM